MVVEDQGASNPRQYRISFCITCMGRCHHLKETLPRNIADNLDYGDLEFVVLDYNSPDGLRDWLHTEMATHLRSGLIRYAHTDSPQRFHPAHAKNMAHRAATGDIWCNLDADNYTGMAFAAHINAVMQENPGRVGFSFGKGRGRGTYGRIYLHREAFARIGGYDEAYDNYSYEDVDFIMRARNSGYILFPIPIQYLHCIVHDDQERTLYMHRTVAESKAVNAHIFNAVRRRQYRHLLLDAGCDRER